MAKTNERSNPEEWEYAQKLVDAADLKHGVIEAIVKDGQVVQINDIRRKHRPERRN